MNIGDPVAGRQILSQYFNPTHKEFQERKKCLNGFNLSPTPWNPPVDKPLLQFLAEQYDKQSTKMRNRLLSIVPPSEKKDYSNLLAYLKRITGEGKSPKAHHSIQERMKGLYRRLQDGTFLSTKKELPANLEKSLTRQASPAVTDSTKPSSIIFVKPSPPKKETQPKSPAADASLPTAAATPAPSVSKATEYRTTHNKDKVTASEQKPIQARNTFWSHLLHRIKSLFLHFLSLVTSPLRRPNTKHQTQK